MHRPPHAQRSEPNQPKDSNLAGVICFLAQELTLEYEVTHNVVCVFSVSSTVSPKSIQVGSSTIHRIVAQQVKAPPPNKKELPPPFGAILPKLKNAESTLAWRTSILELSGRRQVTSCPVKQLLRSFLSLAVATLDEASEGQRQTSLVMYTLCRYIWIRCAIAASDLDSGSEWN